MSKFVEMTQSEQEKTDGGFFCFGVVVKSVASICKPAPVVCYPSKPVYSFNCYPKRYC